MTLDAPLRGLIREALQKALQGIALARMSPANHTGCVAEALVRTAEAARCCRFKSTMAIRKAIHDGHLVPLGRRCGTGTHALSLQALDACGARCSAASHVWLGTFILVSTAGDFGCVENAARSNRMRRFIRRRGLGPVAARVKDGSSLVEGAR
jgi:hypothetical protein